MWSDGDNNRRLVKRRHSSGKEGEKC